MKLAKFFQKKTLTEQKLFVMKEITHCEGVIASTDYSIASGKGCISFVTPADITSSIQILPEASEIHYEVVRAEIIKYCKELKVVLKELEAKSE